MSLTITDFQKTLEEWGTPDIHLTVVNGRWRARITITVSKERSLTAEIDGERWTGVIAGRLEGDGDGPDLLHAIATAWRALKRDARYRANVGPEIAR